MKNHIGPRLVSPVKSVSFSQPRAKSFDLFTETQEVISLLRGFLTGLVGRAWCIEQFERMVRDSLVFSLRMGSRSSSNQVFFPVKIRLL
jgi:hypothetical protein